MIQSYGHSPSLGYLGTPTILINSRPSDTISLEPGPRNSKCRKGGVSTGRGDEELFFRSGLRHEKLKATSSKS